MLQQPSHLTQQRRELLKWFHEKAAPLADAYEGAIRIFNDAGFPGRVHFIAHAVRDIADRLVFVLDPQLYGNRVQYENELDRIEKSWLPLQKISVSEEAKVQTEMVLLDSKVASLVDSLITSHRERRSRPSNHELLFRFLMRNEPSRADVNRRIVNDFKRTRRWFMRIAHFPAAKALQTDEAELQTQFKRFETMLHSFVGSFFTGKRELDEILQQANK